MENHTKYGAAIYYHGTEELYVNLFIPSELTWEQKGLFLRQETAYPAQNTAAFTFLSDPTSAVTLRIRCPGWAAGPVLFELNARRLETAGAAGTFAEIRQKWKKGDRLTVTIPMAVRIEELPNAPDKIAFVYGPAVLAGDLGPGPRTDSIPYSADQRANLDAAPIDVPPLVRGDRPLESSLVRSADGPLTFRTAGLSHPVDLALRPFWEISHDCYTVYWDVMTEAQWKYRDAPSPEAR
jgi:DUF1680 family protein